MKRNRIGTLLLHFLIAAVGLVGVAAQQHEPANQENSSKPKPADLPFDRPPAARPAPRPERPVNDSSPTGGDKADAVRLAVDLVQLDAQVLHQKTGRIAGDMTKDSFTLYEDGVKQTITHFSQDTLPLSVILLIDRGGCLDPFSDGVHNATMAALSRLRPQDEVALMAFHDTVDLVAGFTRDRRRIEDALHRIPPHDEQASHCFNRAFD